MRRPGHPPAPDPPAGADRAALDQWLAECAAGELYSNPLGADGTVYRWWYTPAQRLSLPLLSRVYPDGLDVADGDLAALTSELDELEHAWLSSGLESEPPMSWMAIGADGSKTGGQITLAKHLTERAGYLRQAIVAAQAHAGVVSIG